MYQLRLNQRSLNKELMVGVRPYTCWRKSIRAVASVSSVEPNINQEEKLDVDPISISRTHMDQLKPMSVSHFSLRCHAWVTCIRIRCPSPQSCTHAWPGFTEAKGGALIRVAGDVGLGAAPSQQDKQISDTMHKLPQCLLPCMIFRV